jgi:hypothetical protein
MLRFATIVGAALLVSGSACAQTHPTPQTQQPAMSPQASIDASGRGEDIAWVSDPKRALTNLTVYSRGIEIGHVGKLAYDRAGKPTRVRIVFKSGAKPAWIDAAMVRYDPEKRTITTDATVSEIEQLAHTRVP